MAKKSSELPGWVIEELQTPQFDESEKEIRTGYILDIYEGERKADIQLYEPVWDGSHVIERVDIPEETEISTLEKGVVYAFELEQARATLSEKVSGFLMELGIEKRHVYGLALRGIRIIDAAAEGSSGSED